MRMARGHAAAALAVLALLSACTTTPTEGDAKPPASSAPTAVSTLRPSAAVAEGIPGTLWYTRGRDSNMGFFRLQADGKPEVVAEGSYPGGEYDISPDGTRLAWSDDDGRVVVSNVDGSARKVVDATSVGSLRWSPDSAWLVGVKSIGTRTRTIRVIKADGTVRRDLGTFGRSPTWSADGAWIAYISAADGTELTRVRPDGSDARVTKVKLNNALVLSLGSASPGAEQVLATVACHGCDLDPPWYFADTIIDSASGERAALTSQQGEALFALWTADGKMLVRVMTSKGNGSTWPPTALELRAKDGSLLARQAEPFDFGAQLISYVG